MNNYIRQIQRMKSNHEYKLNIHMKTSTTLSQRRHGTLNWFNKPTKPALIVSPVTPSTQSGKIVDIVAPPPIRQRTVWFVFFVQSSPIVRVQSVVDLISLRLKTRSAGSGGQWHTLRGQKLYSVSELSVLTNRRDICVSLDLNVYHDSCETILYTPTNAVKPKDSQLWNNSVQTEICRET